MNNSSPTNYKSILLSLLDILLLFVLIVMGMYIAQFIPAQFNFNGALTAFVAYLIPILGCTWLLRLRGSSWKTLGLSLSHLSGKNILYAIALSLFLIFVVYYLGIKLLMHAGLPSLDVSVYKSWLSGNFQAYLSLFLFVIWGKAAFGEEMIARGFLMNKVETIFRWTRQEKLFAALIQAVLFGLGHSYQGPTGIILSTTTGLIFALVYYLSKRNLMINILAHGIADTFFITIIYFEQSDWLFG